MKKKKYLVILIIFLALLFIGVGYAAITKDLFVKGTTSTVDTNTLAEQFIVAFENTTFSTDSYSTNGAVSAATHTNTGNTMTCKLQVKMMTKGSYAVYSNYIVNKSEYYAASLVCETPTSSQTVTKLSDGVYQVGDYYKITVTFSKTNLEDAEGTTYDKAKVTVRIDMIKTPITDLTEQVITVIFKVNAVEIG